MHSRGSIGGRWGAEGTVPTLQCLPVAPPPPPPPPPPLAPGAPTKDRNVSCTMLRLPESLYLVDCGEGSSRQAKLTGLPLEQVSSSSSTGVGEVELGGELGVAGVGGSLLRDLCSG